MDKIVIKDFEIYQKSVPQILEEIQLSQDIADQKQILIKPNLTINYPPPNTTPAEFVEEVVKFCRANSRAKIIIGEGAGGCDTQKCFEDLGYQDLAEKYDIELLDLNKAERVEKENLDAKKIKKAILPKIAFESYIINLPVLKIHVYAKMTAAMKNVFGFYLNQNLLLKDNRFWRMVRRFGGTHWLKSELHLIGVNQAIVDLNKYINIDFNLVDASIGQKCREVDGEPCNPPLKKLIAGFSAEEVDKVCAPLLGLNPKNIKYLL